MVHTLGLDKSTRPAGGDRVPGVDGIGDGGDEDEEREGIQSRKAELEQKLRDLSQRPDIYEYLARSLAPSIWEMEDVKKGILLRLFGGSNKSVARGGGLVDLRVDIEEIKICCFRVKLSEILVLVILSSFR